jgi:4-hydroxy-tetrahydrodipicolinate synthase
MEKASRISGVLSPVCTPFKPDLSPDYDRLLRHCRWLLSQNAGLAVFGTNSEANSLSVEERVELLERLVEGGIDPRRMMPGVGCCAIPETVRLTSLAVKLGCAGVLMLPPFYYKGVTDEGLYRSFAEVIDRVGSSELRVYLYHIPPVAQVSITLGVTERLLKAYPKQVVGLKDSSGDWNNTMSFLDAFSASGFDVFVGSEGFLLRNMRQGGRGCISATANVNPAPIARLYETWQTPDAADQQARLAEIRDAFNKLPMIPALKAAIGHYTHDPRWGSVRPPLVPLTAEQVASLVADLEKKGFTMPGVAECAGHADGTAGC